jgi:hypothetical protein
MVAVVAGVLHLEINQVVAGLVLVDLELLQVWR